MLWSVGDRFGFDGTGWNIRRLEFWYRGHVQLFEEESATLTPEAKAAIIKALGGR